MDVQDNIGFAPLDRAFCNDRKSFLAIYIISAGGDLLFNIVAEPEMICSLKHISKESQMIYIDFLYDSGFSLDTFIHTFPATNNDLASHIATIRQTPRSLKRLAANVIRKAMVPNAWVGLNRLPLPPGFDKQYIILHPHNVVSACIID